MLTVPSLTVTGDLGFGELTGVMRGCQRRDNRSQGSKK